MTYSKFFSCENLDVFNTNLEAGIVDDLSLVFISSTKQIWTHGTFYNCPYSAEEITKLVSDSEDNLTEMINSLKAVATTGKDGLMSASDKTKLDSLEKITVDSALSSISTNPVENKAINTALAGKSDSDHTHNYAGSSSAGGAANSVKSSMTLKVNGGNTEGTSKYTFNGSTDKTLDIKAGDNVTLSTASGSLTINAKDTTYEEATQSSAGLMSAADKVRLEGLVSTGGEPNQNAFANVKVGTTVIESDNISDTLELAAGDNVTLTPDATNDKVTIAAKDTTYTAGDGLSLSGTEFSHADTSTLSGSYGPTANVTGSEGKTIVVPQITVDGYGHVTGVTNRTYTSKDTTYSNVTTTDNGLMSSTDKSKLDGIDEGANNYSHPTYTAQTGKPTANHTPGFGGTFTVSQVTSDGTGHVTGMTDRTVTIPSATASTTAAGLMSKDDKTKLNGIESGAQVNTVTGVKGSSESTYRTGNINITKANIGLGNVTNESKATMFTNAALTGTPTAPTATSGANTTQIATTAFVQSAIDSKIAAADAMIYKGTVDSADDLPSTTAKTGWTYKVTTAGTYAGEECEVGDMIICLTDGSSTTAATWTVVQNNIDGAVTGPSSSTDAHVAVFNGATGKVIKDSGFTIGKSVPSNAVFTDTNTKVTAVGNHYTPSGGTTTSASGGTLTDITNSSSGVQVVTGVTKDAAGHVTGVTSVALKSVNTNTTYSVATTSANGLMSSTDKTKLDGIASGATAVSSSTVSGWGFTKNTGTVTSVATGKGLTGGTITGSGTIKCNLNSETSLGTIGTTSKLYAVGVDANNKLCVNVPWTDNNTTYSAATTSALGLVKIGSNITVSSGTISLTKSNVTSALGYTPPTSDTNTHYTTRIYAGASGTAANAAATSPYIKITDDNTYRNQIRLIGSGATTVTSDASGNITIKSTDNNTTYSAATTSAAGLMSAADKVKLDGCAASADAVSFTRSLTSGTKIGTITINGTGTDLYCQTNTNTTYSAGNGLTLSSTTFNVGAGTGISVAADTVAVSSEVYRESSATTAATAGWYRIATSISNIGNCTGIFQIQGATSGRHTAAIISVGTSHGVAASSNITVLQCSHYSSNALTKVRIVYHTAYSSKYAYVEVYNPSAVALPISVKLLGGYGWSLVTPSTAGSIPSGYSNKEATLSNATIYSENFSGNGSGLSSLNASNISSGTIAAARLPAATTSAQGAMTAAMVTKLNGIATGANAYSLPNATSSVLGGVKVGSNITVSSGTISLTKANVTSALGYTPPTTNTTYSVATASANGLMAAADKSLSNFLQNYTTATTLASLNVGYSTIYATLSKATSISLSGTLAVGRSITVICNPTASFTQPIPTSGSFVSMDGDSLSITSGKVFEINIYAYASGKYSISCKTAK